jgi:ABC-2 type transport system ATP-binding protein
MPDTNNRDTSGGGEAIVLDGLTKRYGTRTAVDQLSFSVPQGTICGFIGPNGAGKTTTIRMLLGLVTPTTGTATVLGHSIDQPADYLGRVGAMIEGPAFYPTLSGRRNLEVLAALGGLSPTRVDAALHATGLHDRAEDQFRSYSLGMKQRLGIGAALLPNPDLLLLDEPINGLDPAGIREVRTLLRSQADAGTTILVSSHLLDELQHICDDIVMIREGRLIFTGPVADLVHGARRELVVAAENPDDLPRLLTLCQNAGHDAHIDGQRLRITAPSSWSAPLNRAAMQDGITLIELTPRQQTLEDTFFELTADPS